MRYQRLILDVGDEALALAFHERLTVIAGLGPLERESITGELLGALSGGRTGTCLEVADDDGRALRITRGVDGTEQVLDTTTGEDLTEGFRGPGGRVDVLASSGLDLAAARRRTRLGAAEVAATSQSEAMVGTLAGFDQGELWTAAGRLRDADALLESEASVAGSSIEDAEAIDEIERRHLAFEAALATQDRLRQRGLLLAGWCAVAAIPALVFLPLVAAPFLAVTIMTSVLAIVLRHRVERARRAEQRALAAAGARSYLGFHLQRVEGLLSRGEICERLTQTAEEQRTAQRAWTTLVGDVDVEWAWERRARIEEAARGLADGEPAADPEPSDLAHAIVSRLAELRAGIGGRTLPLILDEPFAGAEGSIKHWLLELIGTSAGNPQIVYLTEDEDVAAWARLESLTGEMALIEPAAADAVTSAAADAVLETSPETAEPSKKPTRKNRTKKATAETSAR